MLRLVGAWNEQVGPQFGATFCLHGGTSLTKGFGLVDRFSEDLDLSVLWQDVPHPWTRWAKVRTAVQRAITHGLTAIVPALRTRQDRGFQAHTSLQTLRWVYT